jgi:hypothetical protein
MTVHAKKVSIDTAVAAVLLVGVIWGFVSFQGGMRWFFIAASLADMIALMFGYFIVPPMTIIALWRPKMSATLWLWPLHW